MHTKKMLELFAVCFSEEHGNHFRTFPLLGLCSKFNYPCSEKSDHIIHEMLATYEFHPNAGAPGNASVGGTEQLFLL